MHTSPVYLKLWTDKIDGLNSILKSRKAVLIIDKLSNENTSDKKDITYLPFSDTGGFFEVFSSEKNIDFYAYDKRFSHILNNDFKLEMAVSRLIYDVELSDEYRKKYEEFIKKRFRPALLRIVHGEWKLYADVPENVFYIMKLKKIDNFFKKELLKEALLYGEYDICRFLLGASKENKTSAEYAHVYFHCLLMHPFISRQYLYGGDIVCDIMACYLTDKKLGPSKTNALNRQKIYDWIRCSSSSFTQKTISNMLDLLSKDEKEAVKAWFYVDDHSLWDKYKKAYEDRFFKVNNKGLVNYENLRSWLEAGEGFSKFSLKRGGRISEKAGRDIVKADISKREGYDYKTFLKQFMTEKETCILDLDSFDTIYYTYGLINYDDMPLIEPLETKEVKRLSEFIIVIDTSGSCSGKLVRFFLEETWSVFLHEENFFDKFNIRIIQCDSCIQEDKVLRSLKEVDDYMNSLMIKGGGGTDFRTAFRYINKLKENGSMPDLKGVLYFTDGFGTFPEVPAEYKTAFIFLKAKFGQVEVPWWAEKLLLPLPENADWEPEYSGGFKGTI